MVEEVMDKETATKLGYVRVIDYRRSSNIILSNLAVEDHATAELKKDNPDIYCSKAILLANFSFLLRIIGYHLILVALPNNPFMQSILLLGLEVTYMGLIVKNFVKLKYLISMHMFISKVTQSFFLILFHIISLIMVFRANQKKIQPSLTIQNVAMWCIIISIAIEYVFLIVNVVYIIKKLIKDRKSPKKKVDTLESQVVYKWVRKESLSNETQSFLPLNKVSNSSKTSTTDLVSENEPSKKTLKKRTSKKKITGRIKKKVRALDKVRKLKKVKNKANKIDSNKFTGGGMDFLNEKDSTV